jgi:predicted thioesterase
MTTTLKIGLTAERTAVVSPALTAPSMGSGSLEVYATPAMIALMEAAAVAAIDPLLPPGQASVGIALEIRHLAATPAGGRVHAQAEVTRLDGRKVSFQVRAWDEHELIGEGTHTRFIVDSRRFVEKVNQKNHQ